MAPFWASPGGSKAFGIVNSMVAHRNEPHNERKTTMFYLLVGAEEREPNKETENIACEPLRNRVFRWGASIPMLLCILWLFLPRTASADFERPATLKAAAVLQPEIRVGDNHTVDDAVRNDGLFNHYTVTTPFGAFEANSTSALHILVGEINAIAAMKTVNTAGTAMQSMKQSGVKTATGLKNLFTDPEGTLDGAASGVQSLFQRAGTVGKRSPTGAEDSRVEQIIGLSKSKGQIATRYGVSMYSRNAMLQKELDRLALADYAGGLGVGAATSLVPGVGGFILTTSGTARLLNETVNSTPAAQLWLQNKTKLLDMGLDEDTVSLFLNNPSFSPALTTVTVTALEAMEGVDNRELFAKVALQAADPDTARTIVETAVLTAGYHRNIAPLQKLVPMARLVHGIKKDGTLVVTLPTDHVIWSERVAGVVADLTETAGRSGRGTGVEIWTSGDFSKRAREEMKKRGWELYPGSFRQLVPGQ